MAIRPLPMTLDEARVKQFDVILITGDAYVDHPSWGVAMIGRSLEAAGFSVGIIAQPDWENVDSFRVLGRPRLFFGVTAGNMDSCVNKFTASRKIRRTDAYSPGGKAGLRPDRATIPYTSKVKQAFKGVPVVIGGVEASLRRFAHFDFWQEKMRRSILLDAKADLLVYGMAEVTVVELAKKLADGEGVEGCRALRGVSYALGAKGQLPEGIDVIELPTFEECKRNPRAFNDATRILYQESNPHCGHILVQRDGSRRIVQNPAALPLTTGEFDRAYELPFTYRPHPSYRAPIPALETVDNSVTVNRGCSGGCSFCALTIHQGKDVYSRSEDSVVREVEAMQKRKGFKGIISDLGGPTANMYHMNCTNEVANKMCRRVSCLHPVRCKWYGTDHKPYMKLLKRVRELPGIRRVYVNSGIRYDLASTDPEFVEELTKYHVQGQLSVAPEHASDNALMQMKKPSIEYFTEFMERFKKANKDAGKEQFLVPYFQCAHPGVGPNETIELALYMKKHKLRPRQVQMFMPTPATIATAIWHSGYDVFGGKPVYVAKGGMERSRQRALLFYWKREEWPHVREALTKWNRKDLIGTKKNSLVPPGPSYGAWERRGKKGGGRSKAGSRGMVIERATAADEADSTWELG
jgi:uncharacterized radical SAM protein YgiQ